MEQIPTVKACNLVFCFIKICKLYPLASTGNDLSIISRSNFKLRSRQKQVLQST